MSIPQDTSQSSILSQRPPYRRLRTYAFDPSLAARLDTATINQATLRVPWEWDEQSSSTLQRGPVGEYLEVIDYDPASGCFYQPVDLNQPHLLAQDGLPPAEGDPQFHQQMVYAVAMTTIRNFERALGRRALWSARRIRNNNGQVTSDEYVPRLRVYPHALRQANAYYSPTKKALLFGYFPASGAEPGGHLPGGIVFTCLSQDVIAHETTHALLDGMHRRFLEPSNPDVLAFHEAFADIVAMFQHFSLPEVLRHQIARTRGDLSSQNLLGQLAQEVGRATGSYGALRDALGSVNPLTRQWEPAEPDPTALDRILEPHARGSLLVAAVFEAFVSIYKSRIADLLRIATGGTGVLPPGNIQPDLANRMAMEAAKAASHILNMCIRALDYCPPVDITFGEYLRALITADYDLVLDDDRNYRVAVIEAFQKHGIYPRGLRSLSVDSLRWTTPTDTQRGSLSFPAVKKAEEFSERWNLYGDRQDIYKQMKRMCAKIQVWIKNHQTNDADVLLGLDLSPSGPPIEVHAVRPSRRIGPDGESITDIIVEVTQRRPAFLSADPDPQDYRHGTHGDLKDPPRDFWFRGGCTLIVDMETFEVRYVIHKDINSEPRLARQRMFRLSGTGPSLRATYFGGTDIEDEEPFAQIHSSLIQDEWI